MSTLKRLLSQTVVYGLGSIVGRAINFLLVPFYTAVFEPEAYGIVSELYAYAAFFLVLFSFGQETAFFRYANKDKEHLLDYLSNGWALVWGIALPICLLIFFSAEPLAKLLDYSGQSHLIRLMAPIFLIDGIWALPFAFLRLQNKAIKFVTISLLSIFLNVGFNLYWLLLCPYLMEQGLSEWALLYDSSFGVGYVFLSNLCANLLSLFAFIPEFKAVSPKAVQKKTVATMAQYGWPVMVMGLAGVVNELLDRILIKELLPKDFYPGLTPTGALGVYSACYKLSIFMTLAIQAFRYAAEPLFFAQANNKNSKVLYARVMHFYIPAALMAFLFISVNLDWIADIVLRDKSYHQGLHVVPILLLANLFLGAYFNLSIWYKLSEKTIFGMYFGLVGAGITLVGNLFLIPVMGYTASALITLLAYFAMCCLSYLIGQKKFFVPYNVPFILLSCLASIGILVLIMANPFHLGSINGIWIGNGAIAVFGGLLVLATLKTQPRYQ